MRRYIDTFIDAINVTAVLQCVVYVVCSAQAAGYYYRLLQYQK